MADKTFEESLAAPPGGQNPKRSILAHLHPELSILELLNPKLSILKPLNPQAFHSSIPTLIPSP